MKYTFGTSEKAAARLEQMAAFFNPLAADLIKAHLPNRLKLALDLGCGPGFTTAMLSNCTGADEAFGMDNSASFLSIARTKFPKLRFVEHDITVTPFPLMADVMYVRFVLSHQREPVELINKWTTQLKDNGILVVEELEDIDTEVQLFRDYIVTNARLVASQGADLFIGTKISTGKYCVETLLNDRRIIPVENRQAAKWFYPNADSIWKESDVVRGIWSLKDIERISTALSHVAVSTDPRSEITWKMRRIVLRKGTEQAI